jgi:hypothetical protein
VIVGKRFKEDFNARTRGRKAKFGHDNGKPGNLCWFSTGGLHIPLLSMQLQGELGFADNGPEDGYTKWIATRQLAVEAVAQKLNLPVGHRAEILLRGAIRLRGILRLANEVLFIEEDRVLDLALVVDG